MGALLFLLFLGVTVWLFMVCAPASERRRQQEEARLRTWQALQRIHHAAAEARQALYDEAQRLLDRR
jgi:type II secretory pathway component PulM